MAWIDDLPEEFKEQISEEERGNPIFQKYKDFGAYVKGSIETASRVNHSLRVPGPEAPESDIKEFYQTIIDKGAPVIPKPDFSADDQAEEFYQSIGKPKEKDGYTVPEDIKLSDPVLEEMKDIAFGSNMTTAQFKNWAKELYSRDSQTIEQRTSEFESGINSLKTTWGMAFDERVAAAKKINEELKLYPIEGELTAGQLESLFNVHKSLTGKGAPAAGDESIQPKFPDLAEVEARRDEWERKIHAMEDRMEARRESMKMIEWLKKNHPKYAKSA